MIAKLLTVNTVTSQSIEIEKPDFTIGRDARNDCIMTDIKISSKHMSIQYQDNVFTITDHSSNGTYVNESKIGKGNTVVLQNGDFIYLLPISKVKANEIIGFQFKINEDKPKSNNSSKPARPLSGHNSPQIQEESPQKNMKETPKIEDQKEITSEIGTTTLPQQPQKSDINFDWIEEEIQCTICNDHMLEAVTVNPCNHHFCGACLSVWLSKKTQECPTCRIEMQGIMKAHTMNNLVEKYLRANPTKQRAESLVAKMKEENLIYKNPENYTNLKKEEDAQKKKMKKNIWLEEPDEDDEGKYGSDDDEEYLSNDEDFDDGAPEKQYQAFQNNLLLQPPQVIQPQFFQNPQGLFQNFYNQPVMQPVMFGSQVNGGQFFDQRRLCKSCAGKQWKDFQCSDNQVHVACSSCARLMPKRQLTEEENDKLQMCCFMCKAYHCNFYYGDCVNAQLQKFMLVKGIQHQMIIPVNFINPTEYDRLIKHLNGKQQSLIFTFMMDNYISKGYFYFQQNKHTFNFPLQEINVKVTPETPVCWLCHRKLIQYMIFRYVQCLKYDEPLFMNEDCHYGINCRHQNRDVQHARKYNHCCEQVKFD